MRPRAWIPAHRQGAYPRDRIVGMKAPRFPRILIRVPLLCDLPRLRQIKSRQHASRHHPTPLLKPSTRRFFQVPLAHRRSPGPAWRDLGGGSLEAGCILADGERSLPGRRNRFMPFTSCGSKSTASHVAHLAEGSPPRPIPTAVGYIQRLAGAKEPATHWICVRIGFASGVAGTSDFSAPR
jgi:hypothetical protein